MNASPRPTIRLIAEDLGVSVSTVSRVLNGKGNEYRIGKETQERVRRAAKKVGFSPNRVARGLRLQSSETIGLVVPDIANPFFASIARGVTEEARTHGYSMLLCDSQDHVEAEIREIQLLLDRAVEGLIVCPVGLSSEHLKQFEASRLATVLVDRYFPDLKLPAVGCDNVSAARQAVEHLIAHGHRQIACLRGLRGTLSNEERIEGYRQAFQAARIPVDETLIIGDAFTEASGYQATQQLLAEEKGITAIFATSNPSAFGALRALADANQCVPDDVSLVSFDDVQAADFLRTPLTTVVQPVGELGRRAAETVFRQIKGDAPQGQSPILLQTQLIERQSVKTLS